MLRRALIATLTAAALLPFGGPAHASCLDDATTRPVAQARVGYTESPKSQYWSGGGYVEHGGTLDVAVHGDALASDAVSSATVDVPNLVTTVVPNAVGMATRFVDCVAG